LAKGLVVKRAVIDAAGRREVCITSRDGSFVLRILDGRRMLLRRSSAHP